MAGKRESVQAILIVLTGRHSTVATSSTPSIIDNTLVITLMEQFAKALVLHHLLNT
jgi:hypothetical protein